MGKRKRRMRTRRPSRVWTSRRRSRRRRVRAPRRSCRWRRSCSKRRRRRRRRRRSRRRSCSKRRRRRGTFQVSEVRLKQRAAGRRWREWRSLIPEVRAHSTLKKLMPLSKSVSRASWAETTTARTW
ncbi:hypothetical protein EYF80_016111 [Liparis tanakae]|uniref:Uncharacterized protein n=1 Tax=Liparis tanakae TaxID=230148 RepID=A0A4Z2I7H3_9TELE|nr:hypothetical protein EYF80_016111 [Liparis tanakae]